jgi:hypothetical protein
VGQSSSQHDKCQVGNMHTYSLDLVGTKEKVTMLKFCDFNMGDRKSYSMITPYK